MGKWFDERNSGDRDVNVAENIVEIVLGKMREEKIIPYFIRNRKNDKMDQEGIDFLVFLDNGSAIPIQVKTEPKGDNFNKKYKEHLRKHPFVKFMIAVPIHLLHKEPDRLNAIMIGRLMEIFDKFKPRT